jgi:hypothetical protein
MPLQREETIPSSSVGYADALGWRKPGWRPTSRKIKSGLLPQSQVARLAP